MAKPPLPELAANYGGFEILGRSDLGETWRAKNTLTSQDVVFKVRPINPAAMRYFQREVALMRNLRHVGLQRLFKSEHIGDHLVLTYEFVPGTPLNKWLKQNGPMSPRTAIPIVLRLLDALSVIHAAGFVYRDVSPQNVILRDPSDPVLIDFNAIGQLTERSTLGQTTVVGEISGKPLYMSPEQLLAAPQTASSDLWGIGAVLYEMLVGKPFRSATTIQEVMNSVMSLDPPDVSAAPSAFRPLLARLLSADPARRPSLDETQSALNAMQEPQVTSIDLSEYGDLLGKNFGDEKRQPTFSIPGGAPSPSPAAAAPAPAALETEDPWALPGTPPPPPLAPPKSAPSRLGRAVAMISLSAIALLITAYALGGLDTPLATNFPQPDAATLNAILFVMAAITIVGLGHLMSRRVHHRADAVRAALPFQAVDLISGDNARDQLSTTICLEIDAYRAAAAGNGDDILTITMVAAAQEYRDAESTDDRIKALQMLTDLNAKVSNRLKPWWLDYEKMVARGISLISLLAGAVALFQAVQALI